MANASTMLTAAADGLNEARDRLPFEQHHAFIIGINAYQKVSSLQTAVADAEKLAEVLGQQQHFCVHPPLLNATGEQIRTLLKTLPQQVGKDDRVFFYFAGHGIAADGDDGPAGYIVPSDADSRDPGTFIAMGDVQQALERLPCRHLLLVLDCCFSGAFKWSSQHRAIGSLMPKRIYQERFDRFITDPAWQVITSAAYDQKALDVLGGKATGDRGQDASNSRHSPFAKALFEGLAGKADVQVDGEGDGVITATELYAYIRDQVEPQSIEVNQRMRQTPGFFPLKKHDKGEFIFLHPRHRLNLPPRPNRSPYMGLGSFDEADEHLFYGRDRSIEELGEKADKSLLVVTGPSGVGKSSVVKAGLLPKLRQAGLGILSMRPGAHPIEALEAALAAHKAEGSGKAVLLIDQFEEVITRCADPKERDEFVKQLHGLVTQASDLEQVVLTVRSDFEPSLSALANGVLEELWKQGRYVVPPFSLEELKEVIVMPTTQEVLIFDPPELVDEIIEEVVQSPGALPLVSIALSQLYEDYLKHGGDDRALKKCGYERVGGVKRGMYARADALYENLSKSHQHTMRKIMLRMVSVKGELASKRVAVADLVFLGTEEPMVVAEKLIEARLIVRGRDANVDYVEAAHDDLVGHWKKLLGWVNAVGTQKLIVGEQLSAATTDYMRSNKKAYLWNSNPNLAVMQHELADKNRWLNAEEVKFVHKSVRRKRRLTRRVRIAVGVVMAVVSGLAGWALDEKANAEEKTNIAVSAKEEADKQKGIAVGALETAEKQKDVAEEERGRAEEERKNAEEEKVRAVRSLFSSLKVNMRNGNPGSVCVDPWCAGAPKPDDGRWIGIARLPPEIAKIGAAPEVSRDFIVGRQYHAGHVLVYAHDGLTADNEVDEGTDNLRFAENALRWLARSAPQKGCGPGTHVLLWEGTYAKKAGLEQVGMFMARRGWSLELATPNSLEKDLSCKSILWYLSDWNPPPGFATKHVPLIEKFVKGGGGLLVGGLGWSYDQNKRPDAPPYAADELGRAFGFAFTLDAFDAGGEILLRPGGGG